MSGKGFDIAQSNKEFIVIIAGVDEVGEAVWQDLSPQQQ